MNTRILALATMATCLSLIVSTTSFADDNMVPPKDTNMKMEMSRSPTQPTSSDTMKSSNSDTMQHMSPPTTTPMSTTNNTAPTPPKMSSCGHN
jgi:hypothetical protein